MRSVCKHDRFYSEDVTVNLYERITCKDAALLSDDEIIMSRDGGDTKAQEIPIRTFLTMGARYSAQIERIRKTESKDERYDLKKELLPVATISCSLTTRDKNIKLENRLIEYKSLVVLDFDDVEDVEDAKFKASMMPWVWYCGLSVSGRGFIAIVPTTNQDYRLHKLYYAALTEEMAKIGLTVDKNCSDVTRTRFLSFDPHAYWNEGCEYYTVPEGFTLEDKKVQKPFVPMYPMPLQDDMLDDYISEWKRVGATVDDYGDWLRMCIALSKLGNEGWYALNAISQSSSHYNESRNYKIFQYCLGKYEMVTMATFYYLCHKYGVRPERFKSNEYDIRDIPEIKVPDRNMFCDAPVPDVQDLEFEEDDDDIEEDETEPTPQFPYEVFPAQVQKIVEVTHTDSNFPVDFIGSSLIVAAAAAVRNSLRVHIQGDWVEKPIVYMAIVGEPGTNKSAPLEFAIKPLDERDDEEMEIYNKKYDAYELEMKKAVASKGILPNQPDYHQLLLNDYTMEALMQQHAANPRGMLVVQDELLHFVRNLARYNGGNDEMVWTKLYGGGSIQITRKNMRKVKLKDVCVSVCGTIQPASLREFSKGRTENGFVDRWLFAYPSTPEPPKFRYHKPMPEIRESWKSIIYRLLDLEYTEKNTPKMMSDEAIKLYEKWYNDLAKRKMQEGTVFRMASTKLEKYVVRLAIVLDAMRYGCDGKPIIELSGWAMEGAIKLAEYYLICGMKARMNFKYEPLAAMTVQQQRIYKKLPVSFTTGEGVKIAAKMGMCERSFKKWIRTESFIYIKRGNYERRYR